uniref:Protein NYNRIN-like n=1 Tax=Tanacetum cinerariifolium TaxID=118510 RepID=A0A6L2LKB8_TANCI|nr:protein NYNRIN-like [Tanacetum cinerariifolium]
MSKNCHFHKDYKHDTNDCRHLRTQIQEAVNSGQLSHLVKGIKKERTRSFDTPRGEIKKDKGTALAEEPILMAKLVKERRGPKRYLPQTRKGSSVASTLRKQFIINDMYLDQTVTIRKQLPEHFKKELKNLLKSNADVFAWTHVDMTGILRTILVERKPFNTEHKLNEYNHIKQIKQNKREEDEDKTAFYVGEGVFCYKKMSFGLKKARETYQMLVDKVFSHQIGRNLKAYVDDMVIKSTSKKEMLKYIQETFERFRSINMKLNLKKCSFSVEEGPFLGHLITKHVIKANPSKVKAVINLDHPRILKDIQSLNGKLAALSQFLSKGTERSLAFFKALKGYKDKKSIQWTTKADKALEKMKKLIQTLPTLIAPKVGETLTMHLATLKENGSEARLMLIDLEGKEYTYALRFKFETTNNEAEYKALLIKVTFVAKHISIKDYLQKVKITLRGFKEYTVKHIRRNQNKKANAVSKLASMTFKHLTKEVLVDVLTKRSIEEKEVLKVVTQERKSWMDPIHEYLLSGLLPEDTKEAKKIRI